MKYVGLKTLRSKCRAYPFETPVAHATPIHLTQEFFGSSFTPKSLFARIALACLPTIPASTFGPTDADLHAAA